MHWDLLEFAFYSLLEGDGVSQVSRLGVVHFFCTPLVQEAQRRRSNLHTGKNFWTAFLLLSIKTGTHKRECSSGLET